MTRLVKTRRGGWLYAVAAPVLALLLVLFVATAESNPFVRTNPFVEPLQVSPAEIMLAAWMGMALPTFVLTARWAYSMWMTRRGQVVVAVLLALLTWFIAAPAAPVCWMWNLLCLLRGKYPVQPWRMPVGRVLALACIPIALLLLLSLAGADRQNAPAATPAQALLPDASNPDILAEIPQEDGSRLMITFGACGVVEETPEGWVLREAWQSTLAAVDGGHAYLSRSPSGDLDVVVVWKPAMPGKEDSAAIPPTDSAGSTFEVVTRSDLMWNSYYYYTLVDVDAPGYALHAE